MARAVRAESTSAVCHWFGVGTTTVFNWRRALGVPTFNEGTRQLWSAWKPAKLPDGAVVFYPAALSAMQRARRWTQRQTAQEMGWACINSYGQMESGRRRSALQTLERLAAAFGCPVDALLDARTAEVTTSFEGRSRGAPRQLEGTDPHAT